MKPIYDLVARDMEEYPLWYFPMDGADGGDEVSVRPVTSKMPIPAAHQMIVYSRFSAANGSTYHGYVYWARGQARISEWKPTMWIDDELLVTFWNGIVRPDASYLERLGKRLAPQAWPIRFASESVRGLVPATGAMDGVYFLAGDSMQCARP